MSAKERELLNCPKCGHAWFSKAKLAYVICPKCRAHLKKSKFVKGAGG